MDPENVTVCKGENATFNCGYIQWMVGGYDTNTTRLLVGPVNESFVGRYHIATLNLIG